MVWAGAWNFEKLHPWALSPLTGNSASVSESEGTRLSGVTYRVRATAHCRCCLRNTALTRRATQHVMIKHADPLSTHTQELTTARRPRAD